MNISALKKVLPRNSVIQMYEPHLKEAFSFAGVTTPERAAMFLANCAHETGAFVKFEEGFGYTAIGLAKTWPTRFAIKPKAKVKEPNERAIKLASLKISKALHIANAAYSDRMGNGDESTNEGYIYRGRGLPMLTGKEMYEGMDRYYDLDGRLVKDPNILLQPFWSAKAAAWFWKTKNMNQYADKGLLKAGRKAWQGGDGGLIEVVQWYNKFLPILKQENA